jgi:Spy/CpxP family protein refolding chaperone
LHNQTKSLGSTENTMNMKLSFLLPSAIVLALAAMPILPGAARPVLAQRMAGQERLNKLNLTEDQKQQMKAIREATCTQIRALLTEEQKAQLGTTGQGGKGCGLRSVSLNEEQKAQIQKIRQAAKQQMEAVLTPEQRQQIQERKQMRQMNRGQRQRDRQSQPPAVNN